MVLARRYWRRSFSSMAINRDEFLTPHQLFPSSWKRVNYLLTYRLFDLARGSNE